MIQPKQYKVGLLMGRFNVFHIGHEALARKALTLCDTLLIIVGSSQESGTPRNPFSVETRIKMIKQIFPEDSVIVCGLPDMTNEDDICHEWGIYLMENVISFIGKKPNLMIYGNDESRSGWFPPSLIADIEEIIVPRSGIPISATELRNLLYLDNKQEWCKYHNVAIHPFYEELRKELLRCPHYNQLLINTRR